MGGRFGETLSGGGTHARHNDRHQLSADRVKTGYGRGINSCGGLL
jgi:hypothetical protein